MGKTKWKAVRSTDILGSRREISSLGIDRGFLEEAAPEPDEGSKGLGAEGGKVVHSRPPRSEHKRKNGTGLGGAELPTLARGGQQWGSRAEWGRKLWDLGPSRRM